jgi:hypothetical protein
MAELQKDFVICGDESLATFRRRELTGARAIELLSEAGGRLLVQLQVGIGKTWWLTAIIEHVLTAAIFDLIVVLLPS